MAVVVSLLRAVNVGSHNKVSMQELRALYESLGLRDVETYIQSGNVVFRTPSKPPAGLEKRIANAIEQRFGFRAGIIHRTPAELRNVFVNNPFASRAFDPRKLLVLFFANKPNTDACKTLVSIRPDCEELYLDGKELYIYFPNGMGRSKMTPGLIEKCLNTQATGRNWNTVVKLLEIAERLENR